MDSVNSKNSLKWVHYFKKASLSNEMDLVGSLKWKKLIRGEKYDNLLVTFSLDEFKTTFIWKD